MPHPGRPGHGPQHMGPKVKAKNTKGTLRRLWHYLAVQKWKLIAVVGLVILSCISTLAGPYLIGKAIDDYIVPMDLKGLIGIGVVMIVFYAAAAAFSWLQTYIMAGVSQQTVYSLRRDLMDRLEVLPIKYFDAHNHGELMSRTTNDIDLVSNTLSQSATQIITSVITVIGSLTLMLMLSPFLTLVSVITVPLFIFLTGRVAKQTRKFFSGQQKELGNLNGYIEETIMGQKVVKAFVREEVQEKQFDEINQRLNKVGKKAQIFSGIIGPMSNAINNIGYALVTGVGGYLAIIGKVSVGMIASFLNYSKQFSRPINEIANQFNVIQSAIAGAERVFEVMDEVSEYANQPDEFRFENVKGEVEFEHVNFSYKPGSPILKDVSLHAMPGENIALVGPTGAGKTTIINLLTRFYDIDSGTIKIDGKDIKLAEKTSLRDQLGIVLQDAYLFADTIYENIRYGKLTATREEIENAAKLANAHHFITKLPHGYDTMLAGEGSNLSHGQRQLITIARAILADPPILILDEATSSVDTRTEIKIQEAMKTLMRGRTSFIIAHRLSTIKESDQILVIKGGEVIERGNHDELVAQKGFYYNLLNGA